MNEFTVVMLEKMMALTIRIKKILESSRICVVGTDSEKVLFNTLTRKNQNVSLVLLDLDIEDRFAMELLNETRKRSGSAPIIVLTPGGKKNFFVEAMLHGATDFIIKPFENKMLVSKIYKYLIPDISEKTELVMLDLNQYIKGELRKAEKGGFPLSIMFLNFVNERMEELNKTNLVSLLFENMKDLFWDTDIFIRFMGRYYFGIFPFCDEKDKSVVEGKMKARFDEIRRGNRELADYRMISVFVSYPSDIGDTSVVQDLLSQRIRDTFTDIQL